MAEDSRFPTKIFMIISAVETVIALVVLVAIPPDPKNAFLFGYSKPRLLMIAGMIGLLAIFVSLLWGAIKKKSDLVNFIGMKVSLFFKTKDWLYFLILFLLWVVIFFPAYRFGKYMVVYQRLQPVIVLIAGISFTFLLLSRLKVNSGDNYPLRVHRKPLVIIGGVIAITWMFLWFTRIGLEIDHDFWGGAATPVLPLVIYVSITASIILYLFMRGKTDDRLKFNLRKWIIPAGLFLLSIIIWNLEPFSPHFFAPKVRPPNYEYYPYSDAQVYDMTAQSLINGEGYDNRGFVQRPLYGFMLFIFHEIIGQDYLKVIFLQTIFYALLPVLLFFLGRKFFSTWVGIALGLLASLRELTAIQATPWMEIVHSKLYMTDIWAGAFAALLTLLFCIWYLRDGENDLLLVLMGMVAGISLLIRLNLLFVFIPVVLFLFIKNRAGLLTGLKRTILFGISALIILFPWMVRNYCQIGEFGIEPQKFRMVIETRFNVDEDEGPGQPESTKGAPLTLPPDRLEKDSSQLFVDQALNVLRFTTAHFLHNEIHSILILPNSIFADSIAGAVQKNGYIQETWTGEMNFQQIIFLVINLAVLAAGLSIGFRKWDWFGLFPLTMHLFYNLANGFARVSGWRYVLVTDWVILLYYLAGLLYLLAFLIKKLSLAKMEPELMIADIYGGMKSTEKTNRVAIFTSIGVVIVISIGMLLPELLIRPKFEGEMSKEAFLSEIVNSGLDLNLEKEMDLDNPDLVFIHTKAFYPRYYYPGEGEPGYNIEWLLENETGNLGFMILNPQIAGVRLNIDKLPSFFPNDAEAYIIGKWTTSNFSTRYLVGELVFIPQVRSIIGY